VLVIGSGGREHALAWRLRASPSVAAVDCAPGNPGTAGLGENLVLDPGDGASVVRACRERGYDLVVVGPEAPLAAGLADVLRDAGIDTFGPGRAGAMLEASKAFAKAFLARHRIPTALHRTVRAGDDVGVALRGWDRPPVVKASGLAAGKGVVVPETHADAEAALRGCLEDGAFGEAGATVVLEERLTGEEASLFVVTDGVSHRLLPGAQDHKRAYDGDEGPNTGGMGAYSPTPVLDRDAAHRVEREIVVPTLAGLREEGIEYRGLLYVGLMMTVDGPRVIEFNVRFGDPETQVVLPRLGGDFGDLVHAAARGRLGEEPEVTVNPGAAVGVVAAAGDYPVRGSSGVVITGIADAEAAGALVFHAGTARRGGDLVTSGGRVLNVVGRGATPAAARTVAYEAIAAIHFEGMRYRRDIARRAG